MSPVTPWFESANTLECEMVLSDDLLFVASIDGSIRALDPVSAEERWKAQLRGLSVQGLAIGGGILYATLGYTGRSGPGAVYGVDIRTGTVKLTFKADDFISTGPALADGVVYFGTSYGTIVTRAGTLFGLHVETKKLTMSADGGGWVGVPVIDGDDVLVASEDETLTRMRRADGAVIWKLRTRKFLASAPAIAGDLVLVGSFDNSLYAADRRTGEQRWRFETGGPVRGTPTIADATVYFGSYDGYVYAVDLASGKARWKYAATTYVLSSATFRDGVVFVGCDDGSIHAIDAGTGKPKWVWLGDDPGKRGVIVRPLVHANHLFVASRTGRVYVLDLESGVPVPGPNRRTAADSKTTSAHDSEVRVEDLEIGAINLRSGGIVVCDPVTDLHDRALGRRIEPGRYPVFARVARGSGEVLVAHLTLQVSAEPPVKWEAATEEPITVDSGTAAFLSIEAAARLSADPAAEEGFGESTEDQMNSSYGAGQPWATVGVVSRKKIDAVVSNSGYGDGAYPCVWGIDRTGKVACLRIDFGISERGVG